MGKNVEVVVTYYPRDCWRNCWNTKKDLTQDGRIAACR